MSPEEFLARSLISLAVIIAPVLFYFGPADHGSWWYPDPDRWGYYTKLMFWAMATSAPLRQPKNLRWITRIIFAIVIAGGLAVIWLAPT